MSNAQPAGASRVRTFVRVQRLWSVLLALALGCDAGDKPPAAQRADRIADARHAVEVAHDDALRAEARLNAALRGLDQFDHNISEAVTMVADAVTQADRDAAMSRLRSLQKEQAELETRVALARAAAEKARRQRGMPASSECANNPLAVGCP